MGKAAKRRAAKAKTPILPSPSSPPPPPPPTTTTVAGPRPLSSSSAASPRLLLGHFHDPTPATPRGHRRRRGASPSAPAFQPLTAASPRLSLDFLPDASDFTLFDSHLGLLLLCEQPRRDYFRSFIVCDPVSRRHALFHPLPIARLSGGRIFGAAILSRDATGDKVDELRFEVVCVAVEAGRPRAWVGSFRDGECHWRALPRSRAVTAGFDPYWFENICVHAAGSLYWHVCNYDSALALDPATMEFSFLRAPALLSDPPRRCHKYRVGEMPKDGQLCVASMEDDVLQLFVRSEVAGSDHGWVLARRVSVGHALDEVPGLPRNRLARAWLCYLLDVDAGRTGKVFFTASEFGRFSYHMDTGKLGRLMTEDGQDFGKNIFAYFSAPDGCSV